MVATRFRFRGACEETAGRRRRRHEASARPGCALELSLGRPHGPCNHGHRARRLSRQPHPCHLAAAAGGPVARLGEGPYKGLFALASLVGILLTGYGFGLYRAGGFIDIWTPPRWPPHVTELLVWPAIIAIVAAYVPGEIKRVLKHPMLVGVKLWAWRTSSPMAISARSFCSDRSWPGPSTTAFRSSDARMLLRRPLRRAVDIATTSSSSSSARSSISCSASGSILGSSACRCSGAEHVGPARDQAADRARHSHPQGRRADRVPHLLPRPYGAPCRSLLRREDSLGMVMHGFETTVPVTRDFDFRSPPCFGSSSASCIARSHR